MEYKKKISLDDFLILFIWLYKVVLMKFFFINIFNLV